MAVALYKSKLPTDILLSIVDFVCPASLPYPIALPPAHPITRTLLSLTLTSRAIYPTARRLLYTHCLYIYTDQRFLKLTSNVSHPNDPLKPNISIANLLPHITSLYLKPFAPSDSIQGPLIHYQIQKFMSIIGPNLRRLIIDIPLRSLYPEDDLQGIRPILRRAFSNLPNLEEFCSVRDELYLDTQEKHSEEPPVWSLWPKLRTLALYNQDVSNSKFWQGLRRLEIIETVVLTRADGMNEVDIKEEWRNQFDGGIERELNIVFVDVESEHQLCMGEAWWRPKDKMQVREIDVPTSYYGDEDIIILCQQWTKRSFLQGQPVNDWE